MAQRLGQPFVIENKLGQSGGVALGYLTQQPADGYTVSSANTGAVITNQFIQKSLPYNPQKLQPVALLGDMPLVLAARAGGKIGSLKDFIEQARANPGKLTYASPGNGTTSHLVSSFINFAAFDAAGIPDRCVANPRHSGAMAVVCALRSGRQQPLGANANS